MERKRMRFEILLERYFSNFLRILLTNILFAVPSVLFFGLFYFLNIALFSGKVSTLLMLIAIIPLFPFYAGVVAVCRNTARGDARVPVFKTFVTAVKNNFMPFLLHGLILCIVTELSYLSLTLYGSFLSRGWIFIVLFCITILFVLFLLYVTFYVPLMNITYDIPLKYIYKNSLLMAFGELKNNFFATVALAVVFGILFTVIVFSGTATVMLIAMIALWVLLIPATCTFMYVFFVYDGMTSIISTKNDINAGIKDIDGNLIKKEEPEEQMNVPVGDFDDIDISTLKDTDDYIFHNGRMVKQSALLKMLKERGAEKDGDRHD